jgi:hypothetical protein
MGQDRTATLVAFVVRAASLSVRTNRDTVEPTTTPREARSKKRAEVLAAERPLMATGRELGPSGSGSFSVWGCPSEPVVCCSIWVDQNHAERSVP